MPEKVGKAYVKHTGYPTRRCSRCKRNTKHQYTVLVQRVKTIFGRAKIEETKVYKCLNCISPEGSTSRRADR